MYPIFGNISRCFFPSPWVLTYLIDTTYLRFLLLFFFLPVFISHLQCYILSTYFFFPNHKNLLINPLEINFWFSVNNCAHFIYVVHVAIGIFLNKLIYITKIASQRRASIINGNTGIKGDTSFASWMESTTFFMNVLKIATEHMILI